MISSLKVHLTFVLNQLLPTPTTKLLSHLPVSMMGAVAGKGLTEEGLFSMNILTSVQQF